MILEYAIKKPVKRLLVVKTEASIRATTEMIRRSGFYATSYVKLEPEDVQEADFNFIITKEGDSFKVENRITNMVSVHKSI